MTRLFPIPERVWPARLSFKVVISFMFPGIAGIRKILLIIIMFCRFLSHIYMQADLLLYRHIRVESGLIRIWMAVLCNSLESGWNFPVTGLQFGNI